MRKLLSSLSLFLVLAAFGQPAFAQNKDFIQVDGATLKSRMDSAIALARSRPQQTRFWVAYSFDVRPGVGVDIEVINSDGSRTQFGTVSGKVDPGLVTPNAGVFLLHEADGKAIARAELYNLQRSRSYNGYPVYWLGRGTNRESLNLLTELVESNSATRVAENLVHAVSLHDDPAVEGMMKDFARKSPNEKVRIAAIATLRQFPGNSSFLADIVRNEKETLEVRKIAAFFIGKTEDGSALSTLENLYGSITQQEIKEQIIFAATRTDSTDAADSFLIRIVKSDPNMEARRQALFWLGRKGSARSLDAVNEIINSNDLDTDMQNHAVFVLSRRPKDEAIPALINIAKTHPRTEVRKQAIFWLSRSRDERATAFLEELLTK